MTAEDDFFDGFEPKTLKIDPIGPTTALHAQIAQLQAHNKRLRDALEELCGGIEDGGGTDGNGDTFDLTKAIAALTEEEKP